MASRSDPLTNRTLFTRLSQATARWAGKPQTFAVAVSAIVVFLPPGHQRPILVSDLHPNLDPHLYC